MNAAYQLVCLKKFKAMLETFESDELPFCLVSIRPTSMGSVYCFSPNLGHEVVADKLEIVVDRIRSTDFSLDSFEAPDYPDAQDLQPFGQ